MLSTVVNFPSHSRKAKALVNKVVEDAGGATSMPVRLGCVCVGVWVGGCVCVWVSVCVCLSVCGVYRIGEE